MQPASPKDHDAILEALRERVGEANLQNWFEGRCKLELSGEELRVGVASPFLQEWMKRKFRGPLQTTAELLLGPSGRVRVEVDARVADDPAAPASRDDARPSQARAASAHSEVSAVAPRRRRHFSELGDFVVGDGNRLAWTAAGRVCDGPGSSINLLYLHGGVGIGKTHLLEGIYQQVRRLYPALQVTYLTAESFTNIFTQALREHSLPSFRQKFRNIDVLLIDDIDFLDSKKATQEEFLHTLKQLESQGRQVVMTADRHPRMLTKLSEELTSRFVAGLVCRIEPPDFETRREIVGCLAARLPADFTSDALTFVARRFRHSVRELVGALNCLQNWYTLSRRRIGVTVARKVLSELERDCIRIVGLSDIEKAVCAMFGLKSDELKSSRRTHRVAQPRMLAMFLARKHTQAAYSEIGDYFGGRNHSTVISAERKVRDWLDGDSEITASGTSWSVSEVVESLEQTLLLA